MNLDIFADGFTAMPIQSLDDILPARGGTGGFLEPSGIAKHYCGIERFSVGDIMAYGFRRFGYPANGWDDYKELCSWIITTPMEGVFLTVKPTSVSPFGFLLKDPLTKELNAEQTAPLKKWGKVCRGWAKTEHNVILIDSMHWAGEYTKDELNTAYEQWLQKTYPDHYYENDETTDRMALELGLAVEDIEKRFWNEKIQECHRLADEYAEEHSMPEMRDHDECHVLSKDVPETPFWRNLPEDSLERRINEAIYRTILDLKRPVCVRDWQIEIDGGNLSGTTLEKKWEELSEKIIEPVEWVKYVVDEDGEETDELLYDCYLNP